jgi:hypothetical protein
LNPDGSPASFDERSRTTWEFLHATFGEYLVAREAIAILSAMAASWTGGDWRIEINDDMLFALFSHAPLSGGRQVMSFVRERITSLTKDGKLARNVLLALLARISDQSLERVGGDRYSLYNPSGLELFRRIGIYSLNLRLMVEAVGGTSANIHPIDAPPGNWARLVRLWKASLRESDWNQLLDSYIPIVDEKTGGIVFLSSEADSALKAFPFSQSSILQSALRERCWLTIDSPADQSMSRLLDSTLLAIDRYLPVTLDIPLEGTEGEESSKSLAAGLIEALLAAGWEDRLVASEAVALGLHALGQVRATGDVDVRSKILPAIRNNAVPFLAGKSTGLLYDSFTDPYSVGQSIAVLETLLAISATLGHNAETLVEQCSERIANLDLLHLADTQPELYVRALAVIGMSGIDLDVLPVEVNPLSDALARTSWAAARGESVAIAVQLAQACHLDDWMLTEGSRFLAALDDATFKDLHSSTIRYAIRLLEEELEAVGLSHESRDLMVARHAKLLSRAPLPQANCRYCTSNAPTSRANKLAREHRVVERD